jgi:subtilisin family serine protease
MPTLRSSVPSSGAGPGAAGLALLLLVALAATLVTVLVRAGRGEDDATMGEARGLDASAWRGLVGSERPDIAVGERVIVVLEGPSLAQRVAGAGGLASGVQQRRWTAGALAAQNQLLAELALKGVRIRPGFTYTRVLAGFSAVLDARAIALLERRRDVEGVYAVRVAYPAAEPVPLLAPDEEQPGRYDADVGLPGYGGRGITIALLDTGLDRFHPALRGRVGEGFDVVAHDRAALAETNPANPAELERHGTELASILVGAGGPGRPDGVAPRASLLPIRVGGWQPDALGGFAVYGRTDQLIAGLERAVDPNGDGDAQDAARIAVLGLAEPFAAFPDSPSARAVAGALSLDTLVVVPAGNDGPAGPRYGRVSGPGGAAAALTVGAADLRPEIHTASRSARGSRSSSPELSRSRARMRPSARCRCRSRRRGRPRRLHPGRLRRRSRWRTSSTIVASVVSPAAPPSFRRASLPSKLRRRPYAPGRPQSSCTERGSPPKLSRFRTRTRSRS